jgi:hypothetical protein
VSEFKQMEVEDKVKWAARCGELLLNGCFVISTESDQNGNNLETQPCRHFRCGPSPSSISTGMSHRGAGTVARECPRINQ